MRLTVGWHFLYEGIVKLLQPDWSATAYLANANWILSGFFHWLAGNSGAMQVVDFLNIWGLVIIGLFLIMGLFTRPSSLAGILLLLLYYIASPALPGPQFASASAEGSYLLINKNVIEILVLTLFIVFPFSARIGFDPLLKSLFHKRRTGKREEQLSKNTGPVRQSEEDAPRRKLIYALSTLPFLAVFGIFLRRKLRIDDIDSVSGPTTVIKVSGNKDLLDTNPAFGSNLCGYEVSRLILGSNAFGGWPHAHDLVNVRKLYAAYHTRKKITNTLYIARMNGINTLALPNALMGYLNDYRSEQGESFILMVPVAVNSDDQTSEINLAIKNGANLVYIDPWVADRLIYHGEEKVLVKGLEYIRGKGIPAGIACFSIEVVKKMMELNIRPDFYVKSFHTDQYWSAHPIENRREFDIALKRRSDGHNFYHDNMFDLFPEETRNILPQTSIPWIASHTNASGAIGNREAFDFALKNNAGFVLADLLDFEIEESVRIVNEIVS